MVDKKYHLMSRRNFLNKLATLGISGATLQYLSREQVRALTGDPTKEVPRLARLHYVDREDATFTDLNEFEMPEHDGKVRPREPPESKKRYDGQSTNKPPGLEPEFYTIPRDIWEYRTAVTKAANELNAELPSVGKGNIVTSVTSKTKGGTSERVVKVARVTEVVKKPIHKETKERLDEERIEKLRERGKHDQIVIKEEENEPEISLDELREKVPETVSTTVSGGEHETTVENIPTIIEEERQVPDDTYFYKQYEPIPGGCYISDTYWMNQSGCTAAAPMYDTDRSEYVILTNGHCFDEDDSGYQHEGYHRKFGSVDKRTEDGWDDVATITIDENGRASTLHFPKEGSGIYDDPIGGIEGYDKLEDKEGDKTYEVGKHGQSTGVEEYGWIDEISDSGTTYPNGRIDLLGVEREGGDSGGPYWHRTNGYFYLVGMHTWGGNQPTGQVMQFVAQNYNLL